MTERQIEIGFIEFFSLPTPAEPNNSRREGERANRGAGNRRINYSHGSDFSDFGVHLLQGWVETFSRCFHVNVYVSIMFSFHAHLVVQEYERAVIFRMGKKKMKMKSFVFWNLNETHSHHARTSFPLVGRLRSGGARGNVVLFTVAFKLYAPHVACWFQGPESSLCCHALITTVKLTWEPSVSWATVFEAVQQ